MRDDPPVATPLANPGVRFPPPLLFVAALLIGWALREAGPGMLFTRAHARELAPGRAIVVAAGLALVAWGILTFRAAHTGIIPNRSASGIVTAGPYRFTRNPMYLGMSIALVGGALVMNTLWPILLLPIVLALLVRLVIRREEAYLAQAFPADFRMYCARVRRWI